MKNILWVLAFLASLVFLFAAYYVTKPGVRTAVDARAPWVQGFLRPFIRESGETVKIAPKATPAPEPVAEPVPAPVVASVTPPPATPAPAEPEVFDLKKLAANRAAWPAKVTIAKAVEFPALANGKVVGSVQASAGTEVGLVTISGGKLGVEYQGGGAWLFVEETDLVERWQKKPR